MKSTASKLYFGCSALALSLTLAGCGSSSKTTSPSPTPSSVKVALNQTTVSVSVGSTSQFTATVTGSTNTAVTWAVDGVSGGNSSAGTINSSGLYTAPASTGSHTVTATSVASNSSSAKAAVSVVAGITISPSTATLDGSAGEVQSQQFSATVANSTSPSINWSVNNVQGGNSSVGTITSGGLYTPPNTPGSYTVTATNAKDTSSTVSATAMVFTMSISPGSTVVGPSATQQFTANIDGLSNNSVSWSVDGVAGGSSSVGTISSSGLYTAPAGLGSHQIAAASAADTSASSSANIVVTNLTASAVLTYHNDDARSGAYLEEVTLTPSNVNSTQFGKLLSYPVDGQIYAQPLYMPQLTINGSTQDVVFVETQNNSVYAFSADAVSAGAPLWEVNLGSPVGAYDTGGPYPNVGILSTPVIDATTNTMYLVAENSGKSATFYLHALDITTGKDVSGSPVAISASFNGDTLQTGCYQRMGLALNPVTNWIYMAFGSCTHGWVLAYDKSSLAQKAVFDDTNGAEGGGLWGGGAAPAIDDNTGNVYVMSGVDFGDQEAINGSSMVGYNDSFLQLNPSTLAVNDYFAPDNNEYLATQDADLGSGGNVLVPGSASIPLEVLGGGKDGNVFVLNPNDMGGFNDSSNKVLQEVQVGRGGNDNVFSTPVYWNGSLYFHPNGGPIKAFGWNAGADSGQQFSSKPTSSGGATFNMHGATASLSANGASNGILWDIDNSAYNSDDPTQSGAAILHAYDATNVAKELYNSSQVGSRDKAGQALKFTVPTIANGRVFIPTANELDIYGLLGQ